MKKNKKILAYSPFKKKRVYVTKRTAKKYKKIIKLKKELSALKRINKANRRKVKKELFKKINSFEDYKLLINSNEIRNKGKFLNKEQKKDLLEAVKKNKFYIDYKDYLKVVNDGIFRKVSNYWYQVYNIGNLIKHDKLTSEVYMVIDIFGFKHNFGNDGIEAADMIFKNCAYIKTIETNIQKELDTKIYIEVEVEEVEDYLKRELIFKKTLVDFTKIRTDIEVEEFNRFLNDFRINYE